VVRCVTVFEVSGDLKRESGLKYLGWVGLKWGIINIFPRFS
jgi:hypothetical protein